MMKIMRITKKGNVKFLNEKETIPKPGDILVRVFKAGGISINAIWCKRNKSDKELSWN